MGKHLPIGPLSVHVAPQFRSNLASVALLCDTGRDVVFSANGVKIVNPVTQQTEYHGSRVGNTYQMRIRIDGVSSQASLAFAVAKPASAQASVPQQPQISKASQLLQFDLPIRILLWHCRLAHASASRLGKARLPPHYTQYRCKYAVST